MFFKKKDKECFEEAPLGYWEQNSYMQVVPESDTNDLLSGIFERVSQIDGVTIKEKSSCTSNEPGSIKLNYQNEDFIIGFFPSNFSLPELYLNKGYYFTDDEIVKLRNAKIALTIFMEFHKDSKKSYHLQLKLAIAMVPNLLAIMDESAERMIPSRWATITASSNVVPGPSDLYTVQAVSGDNGEIWLHTHGLCRCGLTELEILQSDKENYNNHYYLISAFASYMIDKNEDFSKSQNSAYIGMLSNKEPVVVTCISWTKGLKEYKNLKLGNFEDRKDGHNSKTSLIFIYKSPEDKEAGKLSKVSEYNALWGDNTIFFISNEETARMKALAMERFNFVKKGFENKDNKIIIKIGLPYDNEDSFEHIWFELLEFDGDKFKAKLMQEPYNVENMHEGDEAWYTVNDVTDWLIYTPKFSVNPSTVYLLIK